MHSGATTTGPRAGKSVIGRVAQSSVGAKWVMGVTGALFVFWLLLHLGGNLQVFKGAEIYNGYAAFLANEPALLWGQRLFVLVIVVLHVLAGMRLFYLNKKARPQGYQGYRYRKATWITRTMPYTGLLLLAFILFHLAHFTLGWVFPGDYAMVDALGRHDIYTNMIRSFSIGGIVVIYVVGMFLLALHLSHGVWSAIQTFGLNGRRWTPFAIQAGRILSAIIAAGFASIPVAILLGIFGS
ncbi:succinate dehydrogenase cytochrome b subunit [Vulgatibacter incomptus]|uniref:Succinate dehydrogenase cytochrome b subunit n=1 Tax=Vulgatibacter incomptus TaxID=1391653 RepID=A0A0K1PC74_9BACT|nr:succinate dehydrogenase cytochrome b subunit [Vulgatibacter incomptus]AKU91016.1 Succinate dehydrogenase cytochrome b subunit [Vulgatibacter incomptus]